MAQSHRTTQVRTVNTENWMKYVRRAEKRIEHVRSIPLTTDPGTDGTQKVYNFPQQISNLFTLILLRWTLSHEPLGFLEHELRPTPYLDKSIPWPVFTLVPTTDHERTNHSTHV